MGDYIPLFFTDETGFFFFLPYMRTLYHGNLFPFPAAICTQYIPAAQVVETTRAKKRACSIGHLIFQGLGGLQ